MEGRYIKAQQLCSSGSWSDSAEAIKLFCFPHAGGSAASFYPLGRALAPAIKLCPVHLPGRASRFKDTLPNSLSSLVEELTQQLREETTTPYALFGHSMGALIAFELARQLRRLGLPQPLALLVSARVAPQVAGRHRRLSDLPEQSFISEMAQFGGTDAEVFGNEELMKLLLPAIRSDFALHEQYKYSEGAPFTFPIIAYGGSRDEGISSADLDGWRIQTKGPFTRRVLPGNHFYLFTEQASFAAVLCRDVHSLTNNLSISPVMS